MNSVAEEINDILVHHGVKGQKWGVRRYQNKDGSLTAAGKKRNAEFKKAENEVIRKLSNTYSKFDKKPINIYEVKSRGNINDNDVKICVKLANEKFNEAFSIEPKITKDVVSSVSNSGCSMYGLEYRLKQPTSLAGKIASDSKEKRISFEESAKQIKDSIRYTSVSNNEDFVSNYYSIKNDLKSKGYEEIKCKNYFESYKNGKSMHKSVQSVFMDTDGNMFELQFQTPSSQAAKELKIPLYEERRKNGISELRAKELESNMRELANKVKDPSNINDILNHRSESMNSIAEEIKSYIGCSEMTDEEFLEHYGMPRRSGRYPWGSGEDPYQRTGDFLGRIEELKKNGWQETPENIKEAFGMTTTQYRTQKALAKDERRMLEVARVKSLKEDGLSNTEIGKIMGKNESTIRSLLNDKSEARMKQAKETADFLRKQIDEKGMIDVGTGIELELGVSREKLNQALAILEAEGYPVYKGGIPQVTNKGKQINQMVICPPGTEHKEIYNYDQVHSITEYVSHDNGETFDKFVYPKSMDSSRLMIRYKEDGGIEKDGVMELRRGVPDLDLGESHYAQVRILVDNERYLKGMAVYGDNKDFPDGVDIIFNTNKSKDIPKMEVLKKIKDDPDNPFGSLIKAGGQSYYIDENGDRQLSLINKRAEEGDWTEWKDKLPSQFLSKQPLSMAKKQLGLAIADKEAEFDEICSLTNPTVKKTLLKSFADDCDSAAVHLQAAALPGQKYHVIIPNNTLKDDQIYAPGYDPGTKLALIRYPHGGTFEIPICTVVKSNKIGEQLIGKTSIDAVCVNSKVAERLSGADFDGDTVMCIPTHDRSGKVKVASTPALKGLEGFDSKSYQYDKHTTDPDGTEHYYRNGREFRVMKNTQNEMGKVSNLITDMTLRGATQDELAAAVRHSMVVIDAEKHKLDYKQSELDNNISALKKKYQNGGGASTLISRSKSEISVDKRQGTPRVNLKKNEGKNNPETGDIWYDPSKPEGSLLYKTATDLEYKVTKTNKRTGQVTVITKKRSQQSTKMAETDDAYTLISDANTPMERVYADYANTMKAMANRARVEASNSGKIAYSPTAKKIYKVEVDSLDEKLKKSLSNAPRERQAQLLANVEVNAKKQSNPNMKKEDVKKASQQALTKYRTSFGAKRESIKITDKEWEAIQAGAISENKLIQILNHTDTDNLRQKATPRSSSTLSTAKVNKIKAMSNSNFSLADIAKACGVSTSTVSKYLKGAN